MTTDTLQHTEDVTPRTPYGVLAEFATAEALIAAAKAVGEAGYTATDAFAPYPIEDLDELLAERPTRLPWLVLGGAIAGGVGGFAMQYFAAVIDYPVKIGGKPLNSWPMFLPVTFECAILAAGLVAVFGMILLNGLPLPYHPLFNVEGFERASQNSFFLAIETADPKFDLDEVHALFAKLGAKEVTDVPA